MAYSNSNLISYTRISPNKNIPRNHKIDTISIHHIIGQCSVETLGSIFAQSSKQESSNYGIGSDGRIGLYVEERDCSWCTSNTDNDNRAITITVASDTKYPYEIKPVAYKSLIKLIADICKRNDIQELKWKGDSALIGQIDEQNMTVHRWFTEDECPGEYLYLHHEDIANKVNMILEGREEELEEQTLFKVGDRIKLKKNTSYINGKKVPSNILKSKIYIKSIDEDIISISNKKKGVVLGKILKTDIDSIVTNSNGKKINCTIKVNAPIVNIRKEPNTNADIIGVIVDQGTYTITDIIGNWGFLKSQKGWICLTYTTKI